MTTLYDNTRLKDYRNCPRFFYFRHVRGWVGSGTRAPLAFGLAWHAAMDVVWDNIHIDDDETLGAKAYFMWEKTWTDEGYPSLDEMTDEDYEVIKMRNPNTALDMIRAYIDKRRSFLEGIEVLDIERPFAVPLDPGNPELFYVGRLDKIFKWQGRIYVGEHKTTSLYKRDGGFRSSYLDSFSPNSQVDGYMHALHMLYGDKAKGIMVDAALVHTKERAFTWIPVERDISQLEAWLWETHDTIDDIKEDKEFLEDSSMMSNLSYMPAFRKNTESCFQFGSMCTYLDICKSHSCPSRIQDPPLGFKVEYWSPFEFHNLQSLGLTEDDQ
jgi:hypothetical protein